MVCLDTQIRVMLSFPLPYSFEFLCTLFLVRLFARGIAVVVILVGANLLQQTTSCVTAGVQACEGWLTLVQ